MHTLLSVWISVMPPVIAAAGDAPVPPTTETPVTVDLAAIVRDLVALQSSLPQLKGLEDRHYSEGNLVFERGRRVEPNPDYAAELAAWNRDEERRQQEDLKNRRKRHLIAPPSETRIVWDDDGIMMMLTFTPGELDPLSPVRAAVEMPVPGYEAIDLKMTSGEYGAWLPGYHVSLYIDGPASDAVQPAVFDVLLRHGQPIGAPPAHRPPG